MVRENLQREVEDEQLPDPPRLIFVSGEPSHVEQVGTRLGEDYRISVVETGAAALAELDSREDVHCVVSDFSLPDTSGITLLEDVRERDPDLPYILTPDEGSESMASDAISADVTDYRERPQDRDGCELLANSVRNAVEEYRTERAAAQLRNRLTAIVEANPDFVFVFDVNARYWEILTGAEKITAHPPETFIGKTVEDLWPPESAAILREAIETTHRTGEGQRIEYRLPIGNEEAGDEHVAWYEGRTAPLELGEADETHVLLSARDVTRRKEVEQDLLRMRRAIDSSASAIMITDTDGTIEYVNPAFEEITGYEPEEAIGENPRILKSGEMPDAHYAELWETILAGDVWEEEVINRRKNGGQYHAHQTIAPVETESGEIEAFVATQTDITERKELHENLQESLQHLSVLDRVLRHNFRNDMTVIEGFSEMIVNESEGPVAEFAEKINGKADQLFTTVEKEREITKLLSNPTDVRTLELRPILNRTVSSVRETYPTATITVELPDDVAVRASDNLDRALKELLVNAVEHSDRESPSIELSVTAMADAVAVRIADDGPGIPSMERSILSETPNIEPLYHGSGLGLWLVNLIVRKSGGALAIDENEPRGSVVTVELQHAP